MRLKKESFRKPTPRTARAAKGFTQRQLAKLVPTTQLTVWKCEHEGRWPKHAALRHAYLRALGLPIEVAP